MAIGVGLARVGAKLGPGHLPPFAHYVPEVDLPVEDARYPYLRLIDPYDNTVFNAYQCAAVLEEFERLAAEQPTADHRAVLELVRECSGDPRLEVWFVGDCNSCDIPEH